MKSLVFVLLFVPSCLMGEIKLLVDAVPSDATFAGSSVFRLPFQDAGSQEVNSMEAEISSAVSGLLEAAGKQDFSYICLLSVPGEDPVTVSIAASSTKLKLRKKNTLIMVAFYREGAIPPKPLVFSEGRVALGRPQVSMQIEKVSLPAGYTPADWIYLNLPRIQSESLKGGSTTALLEVKGEGPFAEVPIPGMKEPLMVPKGAGVLTASWYIDSATEKRLPEQTPVNQYF